jgi:hypothetical protein
VNSGIDLGSGDGGVCGVANGEVGVVEVGDVGGVVDDEEDEGVDSFCEPASFRHLFFQCIFSNFFDIKSIVF